jgi:uncharacterized protein
MKIRLNEIPEDGREYILNRKSAELNEALEDIIQKAPYDISLYIKPISSKDFDVTGQVSTQTSELCSRCGEDFQFNVKKTIHEILIPDPGEDRTGKYAKTSAVKLNTAEETLTVSSYKSSQFDLGEFVHEAVALEVPFNPICQKCEKSTEEKPFIYDEKMSEEAKPNPFQSLKGLKLN